MLPCRLLGIFKRHVAKPSSLSPLGYTHRHLIRCGKRKIFGKKLDIVALKREVEHDLARNVTRGVIIIGYQRYCILTARKLGVREDKLVFIDERSASDGKHSENALGLRGVNGKHVAHDLGIGDDLLLLTKSLYRADSIAQSRCTLKAHILGCLLHIACERLEGTLYISVKHPLCLLNKSAVFLRGHRACAGGDASSHITVNAGALLAYITRKLPFAGGEAEYLDDSVKSRVCLRCTLIGSEVSASVALSVPCDRELRKLVLRNLDIRIGLRILQLYIVSWRVLLYQGVFKSQRLDLGVADDVVKVAHERDHSRGLWRGVLGCEIARNPVFKLF